MKELNIDYRDLMDPVSEEEVNVEIDPLFGLGPFPDKVLYKKTNKRLYQLSPHKYSKKHIQMKLDYLPFLSKPNITNSFLRSAVNRLITLFESQMNSKGILKYQINYDQAEALYLNSPELNLIIQEIYTLLKGCQVSDAVETAHILSSETFYFKDIITSAPIWDQIEQEIEFNLHIMTFRERCKVLYALTFKFPKKCSFSLRQKIVTSLLNSDFNGLNIYDLMLFSTATRHERNNDKCHRAFYMNILKRGRELDALPINSSLPVDAMYTFLNNKLPNLTRKKLQYVDEENEEEISVIEFFYSYIIPRIGKLSIPGLMRLISSVQISKLNSYHELSLKVSKLIVKKLDKMEPDILISFLSSLSKVNRNTGMGDRFFWDSVNEHVEINFKDFRNIGDLFLFMELFRILAFNGRISMESFEGLYLPIIDSYLETPEKCNWETTHCLVVGILALDQYYRMNKLVLTTIKKMTWCMCLQGKSSTIRQQYYLRLFRLLVESRVPEWDLSALDVSGFYAENEFSPWKIKNSSLTNELRELMSISQAKMEMCLTPLFVYENSFLVDLVNKDFKFAIILKTADHILFSSRQAWEVGTTKGQVIPDKLIHSEILQNNGWHVVDLSYEEFQSKGDDRAEWFLELIQKEFEYACEKRPDPYMDLRNEVEELVDTITSIEFKTLILDDDLRKRDMYKQQLESEGPIIDIQVEDSEKEDEESEESEESDESDEQDSSEDSVNDEKKEN